MPNDVGDIAGSGLPASVGLKLAGIPAALVPECIKALNRLVGAAIEIPVAWLAGKKAQIEARAASSILVEKTVGQSAALAAGADELVAERAMNSLLRGAYRKQQNRDAVALAAVEALADTDGSETSSGNADSTSHVDEDWFNIYERFVDDASTERMQKLWGRVLAGEIRKPGRYSPRTLRFLAEFSLTDALQFEEFSHGCFGNFLPTSAMPGSMAESLSTKTYLSSIGLFQGVDQFGVSMRYTFNSDGVAILREDTLKILMYGYPNSTFEVPGVMLTPLAQELLSLVPARDPKVAAQTFANSIRSAAIRRAFLVEGLDDEAIKSAYTLWTDDS